METVINNSKYQGAISALCPLDEGFWLEQKQFWKWLLKKELDFSGMKSFVNKPEDRDFRHPLVIPKGVTVQAIVEGFHQHFSVFAELDLIADTSPIGVNCAMGLRGAVIWFDDKPHSLDWLRGHLNNPKVEVADLRCLMAYYAYRIYALSGSLPIQHTLVTSSRNLLVGGEMVVLANKPLGLSIAPYESKLVCKDQPVGFLAFHI